MIGSANSNCFICRMFRSFAFTGLGALVGGYGALFMGATRGDATLWAFGGAVVGLVVMKRVIGLPNL